MDLREHFLRLARTHGADGETAERWWRDVESRYGEPHRHYHTLQHIGEMLVLLPHANETVLAAVWFHDAIYDGNRNEERSAALARIALTELRFDAGTIQAVEHFILATKRHDASETSPEALAFLDADLAILGSDRARYEQYVQQVREEYSYVPEPMFRGARAAILDGFLARPRIYMTDELYERFEGRARENIEWELAR